MKKKFFFSVVLAKFLLLNFLPQGFCGEGTTGDYMSGIGTKFGRGLLNVVSSPAEIPCTIRDDLKDNAGPGFFTGFGKGTAFFLRRVLVGATEVGTFMIPMEATLPPVCKSPSVPQ